jgi:lipopolysaccharide transport system ATP-binding protein
MSSNAEVIRVRDLSKCYHIYEKPQDRLKQSIVPRLQRLFRRQPSMFAREFWALKGVSFTVEKGEAIGIIGRNGSGKSTLLQLIAGVLAPTGGWAEVSGRVAALLELGSGFNYEFTGRENVFMNGAVLGLSDKEVTKRFDEIADFAAIGAFIDQPVKTYSSGMVVRLAFAVSACVDPDILIIDEALAVGDASFQFKCMERLKMLIQSGTTLLFVSHDMGMVKAFCNRAIYLRDGMLRMEGAPDQVAEHYFLDIRNDQRLDLCGKTVERTSSAGSGSGFAFGTDDGRISKIVFGREMGQKTSFIRGERAEVEVDCMYRDTVANPSLSLIIQDRRLVDIGGRFFVLNGTESGDGWKTAAVALQFPVRLAPGHYHITARLEDRPTANSFMPIDKQVGVLSFEVVENEHEFLGMVDLGIERVR